MIVLRHLSGCHFSFLVFFCVIEVSYCGHLAMTNAILGMKIKVWVGLDIQVFAVITESSRGYFHFQDSVGRRCSSIEILKGKLLTTVK